MKWSVGSAVQRGLQSPQWGQLCLVHCDLEQSHLLLVHALPELAAMAQEQVMTRTGSQLCQLRCLEGVCCYQQTEAKNWHLEQSQTTPLGLPQLRAGKAEIVGTSASRVSSSQSLLSHRQLPPNQSQDHDTVCNEEAHPASSDWLGGRSCSTLRSPCT